jgi:hypothetical protein
MRIIIQNVQCKTFICVYLAKLFLIINQTSKVMARAATSARAKDRSSKTPTSPAPRMRVFLAAAVDEDANSILRVGKIHKLVSLESSACKKC